MGKYPTLLGKTRSDGVIALLDGAIDFNFVEAQG